MITPATFLSLAMQCAVSVHPDTSMDVARTESGYQPLAIGVVGQKKGIYPKDLSDALAHVARLKAEGKNFSVGLMQINQSNFPRFNVTPEDMFNPCKNLAVFEKIMVDCYERGGSIPRALSCYYSGNFETGTKKENAFNNTSYTERIGYQPAASYVVPSTKEDIAQQQKNDVSEKNDTKAVIIYPSRLIRGDLQDNL